MREIPGYYYDETKEKYFKIPPSSTPSNTAYSIKDVKRRRDERDETEARTRSRELRKNRIQKSPFLEHALIGRFLVKEYGRRRLDVAQIFASGLENCEVLWHTFWEFNNTPPLFSIKHRPDISPSCMDAYMVCNDVLYMARTRNGFSTTEEISSESSRVHRFGHSGESTSLSIHQDRTMLAMTWLAGSSNAGIGLAHIPGTFSGSLDDERPTITFGPGTTHGQEVDMWTSTPAPSASSLLFAFGSSHGIITVDKDTLNASWAGPNPNAFHQSPRGVFALEFLANDPSVLLSGCRKGILNITDLRTPVSNQDEDTINHPGSITHIRQLDNHRILVAGLNSSLCQYDLRFRKLDASTQRGGHNLVPTRPILQYPDFKNSYVQKIGFDVDVELGVIATANQDGKAISLFSLHGGQLIKTYKDTLLREDQRIKCLIFAEDVKHRLKNIYWESNMAFKRWAWVGDTDDDSIGASNPLPRND
ncbi:hypothetical protein B7494_g6774 [Chlorociboria aeruginascens]|nr:hypothetical protein B7494_g6774 [Chlorociboria aeruginascens]